MKKWFVCLLLSPTFADATVVEYAFTGTVTSADGIYSGAPVGAVVIGTYRFDLDAAIPGQGTGSAGSYTDPWTVDSLGGTFYHVYPNPPAALVFSTSGRVVGTSIAYETGSINGYQNYARLQGDGNFDGGASFFAWEGLSTDSRNSAGSALYLLDSVIKMYAPDGLPNPVESTPSPTGSRYGYFLTEVSDSRSLLYFDINSMTPVPVPEPGSAVLLLSGMVGLGVFRKRRSE